MQEKKNSEIAEKILIACGVKTQKVIKQPNAEQRLREIAGRDYVGIYKMMLELNITNSDLIYKDELDYWGRPKNRKVLVLQIIHDKGAFSFPIENICKDPSNNEEFQNIFFNALNLPVTSKQKVS